MREGERLDVLADAANDAALAVLESVLFEESPCPLLRLLLLRVEVSRTSAAAAQWPPDWRSRLLRQRLQLLRRRRVMESRCIFKRMDDVLLLTKQLMEPSNFDQDRTTFDVLVQVENVYTDFLIGKIRKL